MQFVNNLLMESMPYITSIIYFIATFIETYLITTLLLLIFNIKYSQKQKLIYVTFISLISETSSAFVPSPFNVIINYVCMILALKFIFKINLLKALASLIVTLFVFGVLNTLIQNPYLTICNIHFDTFLNTPKYRIPYLIILYSVFSLIIVFFKKCKNINIKLDLIDNFDKKTKNMLFLNVFHGLLILVVQLIITDYYIDIVPLGINLLNFILLISFLILSICSFSRMLKLVTTEQQLACAEEYNKSLKILYDKVNGFKHDFDNMISFLDGYIQDNDMDDLKEYFTEMKKDCKITNSLSLLNPNIINNPGIYSLLNNEYFKATKLGITFNIEVSLNINSLEINTYIFSRILGVLIDNAIEAAEKCDTKKVKVSFIRENINSRAIIIIKNTYSNKDVDIEKIFKKGISNKENHSGIGLWEVNKYVKKSLNLELKSSKDSNYFKQELFIYDL